MTYTRRELREARKGMSEKAMLAWERVQRLRCDHDLSHYRRLLSPAKVGGGEAVILDLGPCLHFPEFKRTA